MLKIDYISSIPKEVFANEALTASDRLVLMVLISLQRYNCYANGYTGGLQEIADTLHFGYRTVKKSIATLKDLGLISTLRYNGTGVTIKVQNLPQLGQKMPRQGAKIAPSKGKKCPDNGAKIAPPYTLDIDDKNKAELVKNTPDPQGEAAAKKTIETLCMEIREALRPEDCMAIYGKAYDMVMADLDAFRRHLEIGGETTMAQARFNNRFRRFCKGGSDTAPKSGSFDERKQVHRSDYDEPTSDIEF